MSHESLVHLQLDSKYPRELQHHYEGSDFICETDINVPIQAESSFTESPTFEISRISDQTISVWAKMDLKRALGCRI